MYYVYILQTQKSTYTGCTSNLKKRMHRHRQGEVPYTKKLRPIKLLFYATFPDKYLAYKFEKYLKSGSGRAFLKKRLIN